MGIMIFIILILFIGYSEKIKSKFGIEKAFLFGVAIILTLFSYVFLNLENYIYYVLIFLLVLPLIPFINIDKKEGEI